jgi:inner membrane protein
LHFHRGDMAAPVRTTTLDPSKGDRMRTSPILRLLVMGILLLALNVPLTMMCGVVGERAARRNEVAREVSADWGSEQTIAGPVLSIPYRYTWIDSNGREQSSTELYHFLPESLEIDGTIEPAERRRSIFTVIVYTARVKMRGRFAAPRLTNLRPAPVAVLWDQAKVSIGVRDPRGIARAMTMTWNGQTQRFVPGSPRVALFSTGVQADAPGVTAERTDPLRFELESEIKGTRELRVVPSGNETLVRLASTWPHPSFTGTTPDPPRIDGTGFAASWRVPYFGRGFPPEWKGGDTQQDETIARQASASAFGVSLIQPVDIYVQTERAVKYAALFIVMTFVIAFLWEITGGVLVHPIQYLFVGFTMCVFYLLLLSLAEHRGFDAAYAIAATATIALLAWYWSWVLGGRKQGFLMGGALTGLYGYLYLLLRLEDYALLAGSLGLFLMLALVMFLTRRINWYELKLGVK